MGTRMKDIAKNLGVSVVTVSKVLRNHPDIGEAPASEFSSESKSWITVQTLLRAAS